MIEWYIEQTLQELHIQKRYCGYRLLVLSTVLALEDENSLTEVESRIYKPVARQYHCKPSNVERNIRTVAKRTWEQFPDGTWLEINITKIYKGLTGWLSRLRCAHTQA